MIRFWDFLIELTSCYSFLWKHQFFASQFGRIQIFLFQQESFGLWRTQDFDLKIQIENLLRTSKNLSNRRLVVLLFATFFAWYLWLTIDRYTKVFILVYFIFEKEQESWRLAVKITVQPEESHLFEDFLQVEEFRDSNYLNNL